MTSDKKKEVLKLLSALLVGPVQSCIHEAIEWSAGSGQYSLWLVGYEQRQEGSTVLQATIVCVGGSGATVSGAVEFSEALSSSVITSRSKQ